MALSEALEAVLEVVEVLEHLDARYLVSGSVASSFHGIPRSTQDVDLVVDLRPPMVAAFASALEGSFYLDVESIRAAVRKRRSFNLIHLETLTKVDIFVLKGDRLSQLEMMRGQPVLLGGEPRLRLRVASAEDTVLQKLLWYRQGGEVSDRQWQDILGVLKVAGPRLDLEYLRAWSRTMEVDDLLARALGDAGLNEDDEGP